jgi:hypothetical protein
MKFIENYSHWIKQKWIDAIDKHEGIQVPRDYREAAEDPYFISPLADTGWDEDSSVYNILYTVNYAPKELDLSFVPWLAKESTGRPMQYYWWIEKFLPGMIYPNVTNSNYTYTKSYRYWMPLQDYVTGHMFVYEDKLITGYKKGDVYMFSDEDAYHYAGNAGDTVLSYLNITAGEELL